MEAVQVEVRNPAEQVTIRPVAEGDAPALGAFYDDLSDMSRRFYIPYRTLDMDRWRKVVRQSLAGDQTDLIAVKDGVVVGHGFLWKAREAEPELGLGIADAYQGRGLGTRFMEILLRLAREELGSEAVTLSVCEPNDRARHLYEKHGFLETHRQRVRISPRPGAPRMMMTLYMRVPAREQMDGGNE